MKAVNLLAFALVMFIIPMIALYNRVDDTPMLPVTNPPPTTETNEQEEIPANSSPDPVQNLPAQPPERAAREDDGFTVLDTRTGETFTVSARDYTRGALAAEMPPTFHPEALKAQAVAAHTYAQNLKYLNEQGRGEERLNGADLSADPENWKSYTTEAAFRARYGTLADAYWKTICTAADAVSGYLLTYEDEPILAAYHSMSSGVTEDAANVWLSGRPYLVPVESFGDTLAPDFTTEQRFTADQVATAVRSLAPEVTLAGDPGGWFTLGERSEGGYLLELTAGDVTLSGKALRGALELRSADFEVAWDGKEFCFTVTGYGHGVGLSQYGADYMARQGATFDEILSHYYPGAVLTAW